VTSSGVDTDTAKFLAKTQNGLGYTIVADKDIEIKSIQLSGTDMLLGDPIPVAADTRRTRAAKHPDFNVMVISVLSTNTIIKLEVF